MASHNLPILTSTYTSYTAEVMARIDDAVKWNNSTLTTATNLPTDSVRWNATSLLWERNNGTPAAPSWVALSSSYAININGTVGANTPAAGVFTALTANTSVTGAGFSTYLASSPAIGGTTACPAGTFTTLTVNTTCTLPAVATVTAGGTIVGTTATQTLTNKTLTTPTIASIINAANTINLPTTATTLVGTNTTDTLSNKTLTAPRFANTGGIYDENGNEQIGFVTTAAAVTFLNITNGATGTAPSITAAGQTDTSLNLRSSGTGTVQANGVVIVDLSTAQSLSNKTLNNSIYNGTVGATTPAAGSFTDVAASGNITGAGFTARFATPGPIGSTTASTGAFTTVNASGAITGASFSGSGSGLTAVPSASLTGALPALSGANLTSLTAANLTGDVPKAQIATNLNASGTAPFYVARAWVTFNGTLAGTFAGGTSTVSRTAGSTTATVTTTTAHGLVTGNTIQALTGVVAGTYTVTVLTSTTFTITTVATTLLSAASITFGFNSITASGNVSSITDNGIGDYTITFATAMPTADYVVVFSNSINVQVAAPQRSVVGIRHPTNTSAPTLKTTTQLRICVQDEDTQEDVPTICVAIFC